MHFGKKETVAYMVMRADDVDTLHMKFANIIDVLIIKINAHETEFVCIYHTEK